MRVEAHAYLHYNTIKYIHRDRILYILYGMIPSASPSFSLEDAKSDVMSFNSQRLSSYKAMVAEANNPGTTIDSNPVKNFSVQYVQCMDAYRKERIQKILDSFSDFCGFVGETVRNLAEAVDPQFTVACDFPTLCTLLENRVNVSYASEFARDIPSELESMINQAINQGDTICLTGLVTVFHALLTAKMLTSVECNIRISFAVANHILISVGVPLLLSWGDLSPSQLEHMQSMISSPTIQAATTVDEENKNIGMISVVLQDMLQAQWIAFDAYFNSDRSQGLSPSSRLVLDRNQECVICLEDSAQNACDILSVCCSTPFHISCLAEWLRKGQGRSNCPQCRSHIHFAQRETPDCAEEVLAGVPMDYLRNLFQNIQFEQELDELIDTSAVNAQIQPPSLARTFERLRVRPQTTPSDGVFPYRLPSQMARVTASPRSTRTAAAATSQNRTEEVDVADMEAALRELDRLGGQAVVGSSSDVDIDGSLGSEDSDSEYNGSEGVPTLVSDESSDEDW